MMPEMDGVELLRLLGEQKCKAGIVLMSGVGKRTMSLPNSWLKLWAFPLWATC